MNEIKLPTEVRPLGLPPKQGPPQRQEIRRMGLYQILLHLKREFPTFSRPLLRSWARELHKAAWNGRDKDAIAKLKLGTLADPDYWKGAKPWESQ